MARRKLGGIAVVTFSLLAPGVTSADPLPQFDVDARCAIYAPDGREQSRCVDSEQQHYDNLKIVWDSVSADWQRRCVAPANKFAMAYTMLDECVAPYLRMMERSSPPPKFER